MKYSWKRLWCNFGKGFSYDQNGFVLDSSSYFYSPPVDELLELEQFIDFPILILLGEPGIGKSHEIYKFFEFSKLKKGNDDEIVQYFNLHDFPSEESLSSHIFKTETYKRWEQGNFTLTFFFDSFDEGLLTIKHLADYFQFMFGKIPFSRLRLRITCRPMDWPLFFEDSLVNLWGRENIKKIELIPLNRKDIYNAAIEEGINPDNFIKEIIDKQVVPLAIKPVTLHQLFTSYKSNGNITNNRIVLYEDGCRHLSSEFNTSRKASNQDGELSPYERMKIAGRIATSIVISNKAAVALDSMSNSEYILQNSDIRCKDLLGNIKFVNECDFNITERNIEETLSTAIFSSRGNNRMGFSHQSYAEFLAAWYLYKINVPLIQIKQLFEHSINSSNRIVPQLIETIIWLSYFRNDVFEFVLQINPIILLNYFSEQFTKNQRESLLKTIIAQFSKKEIFYLDWRQKKNLACLSYENIEQYILPFLEEHTYNDNLRFFVIDLVEALNLQRGLNLLIKILLDSSETRQLRVNAGWALCKIGDPSNNKQILDKFEHCLYDDPNDDLRGIFLFANWPENINNEELFRKLTYPKDDSYYGAYSGFISKLAHNIKDTSISCALNWADSIKSTDHDTFFSELTDAIIIEAWNQLNDSGILERLSKIILWKLQDYQKVLGFRFDANNSNSITFNTLLKSDCNKKHKLFKYLITSISENQSEISILVYGRDRIIENDDFEWLISFFLISCQDSLKENIAKLILLILNNNDFEQIEKLCRLSKGNTILNDVFRPIFGPYSLNSEESRGIKEEYYKNVASQSIKVPITNQIPKIIQKIDKLLVDLENGKHESWWLICTNLQHDKTKFFQELDFEFDITILPFWNEIDNKTRERIIKGAHRIITSCDKTYENLNSDESMNRPQIGIFRAFYLLSKIPSVIEELENDIWKNWSQILIKFPIISKVKEGNIYIYRIIEYAYKNSKEEILASIPKIIMSKRHWSISKYLDKIDQILDDQILKIYFQCIKNEILDEETLTYLTAKYLSRGENESENAIIEILYNLDFDVDSDLKKSITISKSLIASESKNGWDAIWSLLQRNETFGKELFLSISRINDIYDSNLFNFIAPHELSGIYIWLLNKFPPNEDPEETEYHTITPREDVARFRDQIPIILSNIGTGEAISALSELQSNINEYQFTNLLDAAEENYVRNNWQPLSIKDLLCLISNFENRSIQNGRQLIDIIIESLSHLEQELHGETPASIFLWNEWRNNGNESGNNVFRPKEENRLSDFIKLHLIRDIKQRGIVINREVEIRPSIGNKRGEITDLRVDAICKESNKPDSVITVIIETKGSWNAELRTAMKTQLRDRYLFRNQCKNGLYLVGWYLCDQWDSSDHRKTKSMKFKNIENAKKYFNKQVEDLSDYSYNLSSYVLDITLD